MLLVGDVCLFITCLSSPALIEALYSSVHLLQASMVKSGGAGAPALASDDTEAKRAALRDKLASKFKQDLLGA
jgi:hypothetical protein